MISDLSKDSSDLKQNETLKIAKFSSSVVMPFSVVQFVYDVSFKNHSMKPTHLPAVEEL